mmetsp:Transcript_6966/g.12705  ORF Transcript_6966/g.12705 Transcript_6966/m.12705 type:complete len:88 (-) Transcript_6966:4269-4532(-)
MTKEIRIGRVKWDQVLEEINKASSEDGGTEVLYAYWKTAGLLADNVNSVDLRDLFKMKVTSIDASLGHYTSPIIIRTQSSRLEVANY